MNSHKYHNLRIGFIGHGRMFLALSGGFIKANIVKAENITASNIHQMEPLMISESGIRFVNSNLDVLKCSDVIILAVKPHVVSDVLKEICVHVEGRHLIISIAAGIKINSIENSLPAGTRVVCAVPNTPVSVGCGATVCSFGTHVTTEDKELVQSLFRTTGLCEALPEQYLDIVTGLSGSGPAYAFVAIEALSDGGVKMGLPRDVSTRLAAQMLMGAAKMVLETGRHPGELKDAVCSPGGTTITGVYSLEKSGFRVALMSAVEAATIRARQLGEN